MQSSFTALDYNKLNFSVQLLTYPEFKGIMYKCVLVNLTDSLESSFIHAIIAICSITVKESLNKLFKFILMH